MATAAAPNAGGSAEWQQFKAAGNSDYQAGRTDAAVDNYTKALLAADVPATERATILCNRAQAFLKLGNNGKAAEDCTACLTLNPDNVKALFRR
jgi:tetratricopeptide (TPR) repeat protein